MNYSELYNELDGKLKMSKFKNKHGERFYVIDYGISTYITGDEYEWEVLPLFNPDFGIYSSAERREIGKCLQGLYK